MDRRREVIDSSQVGLLGTGSFAEVRRGTYAFSTHSAPTEVAFKIFRGSQQIDASLRSQVRTKTLPSTSRPVGNVLSREARVTRS